MSLIEENQAAYVDGWLQPDQFAYNMAALSAELDALDSEPVVRDPESWQAVAAAGRKYA
jgi:hypothetical protein